jgi:hypothetical protein
MHTDAQRCTPMHIDAHRCTPMHIDAHRCTPRHSDVHRGTAMYTEHPTSAVVHKIRTAYAAKARTHCACAARSAHMPVACASVLGSRVSGLRSRVSGLGGLRSRVLGCYCIGASDSVHMRRDMLHNSYRVIAAVHPYPVATVRVRWGSPHVRVGTCVFVCVRAFVRYARAYDACAYSRVDACAPACV